MLVLHYALATWYKSAKIIENWCPQPHSNHKLKQGEHTSHPTLRTYPTPNIEIWLLFRCLCILCMENVHKWWNIHPRSIKNEMDHEKCLKHRKYCNRIQFGKLCLRPVAGDEVFEETKGCGDEMSICAVSILIPPFRATIIGCINCFYYSESDLLLSMTALFWLFYTYPCPNITHTPHVGLYPVYVFLCAILGCQIT